MSITLTKDTDRIYHVWVDVLSNEPEDHRMHDVHSVDQYIQELRHDSKLYGWKLFLTVGIGWVWAEAYKGNRPMKAVSIKTPTGPSFRLN